MSRFEKLIAAIGVSLVFAFSAPFVFAGGYSGGGSSISVPVSVANGGTGSTTGPNGPFALSATQYTQHLVTYTMASTTWTAYGAATDTNNGTLSLQTCVWGSGVCNDYVSTAALNAIGGISKSATSLAQQQKYRVMVSGFGSNGTAARRCWVALTATTLTGTGGHTPPTGSAAFATKYVGVGYDPSVNSGKWVAASGDGTNETGTDTGVAFAANTQFSIDINCHNLGTSCSLGVNGTYVTKSTNLPSGTSGIGLDAACVVSSGSTAVTVELLPYVYEW